MISLEGKKILVTGATGFLGNRLVERLILEEKAEVVTLVRRFQSAGRLARFRLKMVGGDVRDTESLLKAAQGCDSIVHCAVSFSGSSDENRATTLEGARNVCEAALRVGARRVVHFSTISVYGDTPPGPLNESARKEPGTDAYGASKLEAERLVQDYQAKGLPATILQPTVVYGPWSFWSTFTSRQFLEGSVALPDGGTGLCNAVYVDDVLNAVFLSLKRDQVAHGPYLISAAKPVSWRDYYLAHHVQPNGSGILTLEPHEIETLMRPQPASAAPRTNQPPGPLRQIKKQLRGWLRGMPIVRRTYKGVKAKFVTPRALPLPGHLSLLRSQTVVNIDLAKSELGYQPKFDLARGGKITADWLRWAGFERLPLLD